VPAGLQSTEVRPARYGWSVRWLIALLAFCEAGWLTFDGLHALITGGYVTPKTGAHAGQLGPWARLLPRVGVDPRSTPVKGGFAAYGIGWLVIVVLYVLGLSWARWAMLVAAIGSLWYLPIGTVLSAALVVLLIVS
jgi:hypothetical protein